MTNSGMEVTCTDWCSKNKKLLYAAYEVFDPRIGKTIFIQPFSLRIYYEHELRMLLERVGFSIRALYGGYDLAEYVPDKSYSMLFVCKKG